MKGSTQPSFAVLLACLAALIFLAHARPPTKGGNKKLDAQKLKNIKSDVQWESKWWTPKENNKDTKDSWKAFKTEKPAIRSRWWEEDWHEDEWWAPKDTSKTNTASFKKSELTHKQGESKTDYSYTKGQSVDSNFPAEEEKEAAKSDDKIPEPKALPLSTESKMALQSKAADEETQAKEYKMDKGELKKVDIPDKKADAPVYKKAKIPAAETPREKLNPGLKGDTMISPFEDPVPFNGPSDEAPSQGTWKYHQLSGFGKYIKDNDADVTKDTRKEDKQAEEKAGDVDDDKTDDYETEEDQEDPEVEKNRLAIQKEVDEREDSRSPAVPVVNKQNAVDQFYGFGLEAGPEAPPSPLKKKDEPKKKPAEEEKPLEKDPKANQEYYNKGIIYDVIPGAPDLTHSVKKDLSNSEYMKDFVSTKANLQTSPNPPPPGFAAGEAADSETTPLVPSKTSGKSEKPKSFVKSHPLTYCKVDEQCHKGRMCRNGMCVCLPDDGCTGHHKPVCGSDGKQYPSYCELHRTACITRVHIKIDHSASCFEKHDKVKEMMKIQKEDYKEHLLPKPVKEVSDDVDEEMDEDDSVNSSDYDDDEYAYDDEDEKDDVDDVDEDEEWMTSKSLKIPSSKIYDYSKNLKKASSQKSTDKSGNTVDQAPWEHVKEEMGEDNNKDKEDDKKDYDYQADESYKECSKQELTKFKRQLLEFHCKRFEEPNCKLEVQKERDYLTKLMFSYLDINTDYKLSYKELKTRQKSENFSDLNSVCQLTDLIWYDDIISADAVLSLDEFDQAFNHLDVGEEDDSTEIEEKKSSSVPTIHVVPTLATVGNGLELKCGLGANGSDVVWRRHGISIRDLAMVELLVLDDGSLFFSKMGVHHMGNYSCEDSTDPSVLQVHSLKVQMPPIVKVSPHSQIEPSVTDVKIRCHADGVPSPTISWQKNNVALTREPHHYSLEGNNEELIIYKADYQKDTGAYKCIAKNQAGTSEDVSSLFVIGDKERTMGMGFTSISSGIFAVFHNQGYTAYNPDDCLKHRSVHGDFGYFKFIPDNLDGPLRLCEDGQDCSWGEVVNVKNLFLFISQPAMNRVVVIETTKNWIPVQVISTDKRPVQLHYVSHLDQVWVLCWNGGDDDSTKTIVVVRDASKHVQHRAVHTQPVGNHFDQIQALFIAPRNDLHHSFDYGYVTHNGQQGLTKLDLDNMRYTKAVDLSAYDCVPRFMAFVPIGGHVVVECVSSSNHQTLQLVLDYITDSVVSTAVLSGHPYVSPDSRHVVTVDDLTGKVSVAGVNNEGTLEAAYEVTVSASISDVAFFPSSGHGYLLVLTSADDDDIITINLSTGMVDKMKGTDRQDTTSDWHPSPVKRAITSGDVFTNYLLAPSKSSISIVNVKFSQVKCEYTAAPRSDAAIFVGHQ